MAARLTILMALICLRALAAGDDAFFTDKIQPIFEKRCLECHSHAAGKMKGGLTLDSRSGWQAGGDLGSVITPGDPEKSLLVKAIRRGDPDLKMPPRDALPPEEVALIEEWIKRGAPDPREATAGKIDSNWWSLRPIQPSTPPASFNQEGQNEIDWFVNERLRAEKITPAPEADRRTLIRRVYFDLHGLPPTAESVDHFVRNDSPKAYETLVDALLASPRYGERWARHWLDAIHFADSHGFEHDLIRSNAWRYRDYVIESFNRDTPWPRFVKEQLAADVFFPDEPRLTVALGFLAAGPWDQSTAQTAPKTFDYLDRDDMVTQTISTFASATAHCARCHDHKFDPISQEDYYSLQAVLAGVGKGDVFFDTDARVARERKGWKALITAAEQQDRAILLNSTNSERVHAWERARGPEASWRDVNAEIFVSSGASVLKRVTNAVFLAEGPRPEVDTYTIVAPGADITAVRLEVLPDASLPKSGPGRADNGNLHLSEFEIEAFFPGADRAEKIPIKRATASFNQDGWTIAHALDGNEKTAWGIHPREGEAHVAVFELERKLTNASRVVFQLKQLHGGAHIIGKFSLATTAANPARARVLPGDISALLGVAEADRTETQRATVAAFALREIAGAELAKLPPQEVVFAAAKEFKYVGEYAYKPWAEPKVVNVLKRGDINKPGAAAKPGALFNARFDASDEGQRRAELANWLIDPANTLTWRSIVNRVWSHHFGRGLVDTLNDFGRMGSEPSHPELLDWLAANFRDSGGSLKKLHRLIVTSAAYRRGHLVSDAVLARDPDNELLSRGVRRRLDAESFRDSVLMISGRLDLTMGGPGVQHFKLGKPIQLTPTVDYAPYDWNSPGAGRRSIYRFVYRGLQDPFLDALDFPDAAQLAPSRPFSASPLQSLALLNNDFVLFHSEALAKRCRDVEGAFRLVFQREASDREKVQFGDYAQKHGMAAMCRLLLNSNEFLFVN